MRHLRRLDPRRPPDQAGFWWRLRARFTRAQPQPTAPGLFTARHSPPKGSPVPEAIVPVDAPSVQVHTERLDRGAHRVALTPSQALELARDGPDALHRDRPAAG